MQDIKEFYILCEPIETKIGKIRFFKVKEYLTLLPYIQLIYLQKKDIMKFIKPEYKEYFEKLSLLEIIKFFNHEDYNLYQSFKDLFKLCFDEDVFDLVQDDKELQYYLDLIKKMNCLNYEKPSSNPEIEKFNAFKKFFQKKNNDNVDFEAVYTSVWLSSGTKPNDLYIYEMYALFYRTGQFKNYNTTTLFATVSKDIKIESWCKAIDLTELKEKKTNIKDFEKKSKSLFNNQ